MGKAFRRTSAVAATLAAAVAFAGVASAAPSDPYRDSNDPINSSQNSDDNNLAHLFRIAGPDRVDTSIKLMKASQKWFTKSGKAQRSNDYVIVARADDFADALSSGPLADVRDAPVLLTNTGSIDARVIQAITDGKFKHAILIGGTGIFPESARAQLEAVVGVGDVERQRGVDRYETAVGIAKTTAWLTSNYGVNPRTVNVYLATGTDFPDALAAGAAAADNDGVVLLTKDKVLDGVEGHGFTYNFLTKQNTWIGWGLNGIEIHTVGGQAEAAAKSGGIEDIADTNSGPNRYATAAMLYGKFKNPINKIAIVSGEGFADGVAGGAWVANHDGALLLTRNAFLSPETKAILEQPTVAAGNTDIVVIGGTGSVSRNVSSQIADLMTW